MNNQVLDRNEEEEEVDHQLTVNSLSGLLPPVVQRADTKRTQQKTKKPPKTPQSIECERLRIEGLRNRFVAPDGGYGWVIAFGAFIVQFWIAGLIKSYGVILMEIMQMYPDASASLASWIPAILTCICLTFSPITSGLCQRFSCRWVVFVGGILTSMGISLSFLTTNLIQLCLTFGVLTGFGAGLSTTPGIIMTSRYFNKRRALANGICVSGTAAGSIVIPPLMEVLIPIYGFRGCILILGACMLHVCFSACLYRPIHIHQQIVELDQQRKLGRNQPTNAEFTSVVEPVIDIEIPPMAVPQPLSDTHSLSNTLQVPGSRWITSATEDNISVVDSIYEGSAIPFHCRESIMVHSIEDLSTDSTIFYKEKMSNAASVLSLRQGDGTTIYEPSLASQRSLPSGPFRTLARYIDITLVANPLFLLITSTVMLMSIGCPHALFFLPAYANSVGLSKSDSSLLLSISAVVDLFGRLGFGYIADFDLFPKYKAYSFSIFITGVSVLFLPIVTSFTWFAVLISIYGLGLGCWFLLIPVLLSEYHGTEAIASSYGLVRLFQGLITLVVPPFIGYTKDAFGDYRFGFYVMGSCMLIGSVLILFEPCAKRLVDRRRGTIKFHKKTPA